MKLCVDACHHLDVVNARISYDRIPIELSICFKALFAKFVRDELLLILYSNYISASGPLCNIFITFTDYIGCFGLQCIFLWIAGLKDDLQGTSLTSVVVAPDLQILLRIFNAAH